MLLQRSAKSSRPLKSDVMLGNMKYTVIFSLLIFILLPDYNYISADESNLIGLWKCYKQDHNAKVPECLYSIEFLKDGTMNQIWASGKIIKSKHKYAVKKNRIIVINDDKVEWEIKYLILENKDIEVKMGQWNFVGILTKNHQKVPPDYGCKFYKLNEKLNK